MILHPPSRGTPAGRPATSATVLVALLLVAGCASTSVDLQWTDPQLAGTSLRSAKVLVVCEAYDIGIKRICEQQVASEVTARGADPVVSPDAASTSGRAEDRYLGAARAIDAKAILTVAVSLADTRSSPAFSIGLGGFGIGGGSVRGGVGVSVPIGGGQLETGHVASGRLTETSSGRLLWTAKATAPPSRDFAAQMAELAKAVVGAADKAGLF